MDHEFGGMGKCSWYNLRYNLGIHLKELSKSVKNLTLYSWLSAQIGPFQNANQKPQHMPQQCTYSHQMNFTLHESNLIPTHAFTSPNSASKFLSNVFLLDKFK
jgi:hypothetical protein